jgi:hypothetical protein
MSWDMRLPRGVVLLDVLGHKAGSECPSVGRPWTSDRLLCPRLDVPHAQVQCELIAA